MSHIFYVCTPSEVPAEDKVGRPSYVYQRRFVRVPTPCARQVVLPQLIGWAILEDYAQPDAHAVWGGDDRIHVYDVRSVVPCVLFFHERVFDQLRDAGLIKSKQEDPLATSIGRICPTCGRLAALREGILHCDTCGCSSV